MTRYVVVSIRLSPKLIEQLQQVLPYNSKRSELIRDLVQQYVTERSPKPDSPQTKRKVSRGKK